MKIADLLEGWGGERATEAWKAKQQKWVAVKDKHKDHPEMTKHLQHLHVMGWHPEQAEVEAKKKSGLNESFVLTEDDKQKLKSMAQVHPEVADAVAKVIREYMSNPKKSIKLLIQQVSNETGVNPGQLKSMVAELGLFSEE